MDLYVQCMKSENRCFECGDKGHYAKQCAHRAKKEVMARALIEEMSEDMKEVLRQELAAELDRRVIAEQEEAVPKEEDFGDRQ